VESYATVHQLVSTVQGKLLEGVSAIECVRQIFPPGSMTGAPKLRSVQILESLEENDRGVYSGCMGYLGLNGTCDLSVIIRTAVISPSGVNIGCGGAIVQESDPHSEFEEMLLKSRSLVKAIIALHNETSMTSTLCLLPQIQGVPEFISDGQKYGKCFQLLETLRFDPSTQQFFLLDRHISRMISSATYFGFACPQAPKIISFLGENLPKEQSDDHLRVRLLLHYDGLLEVTCCPLQPLKCSDIGYMVQLAKEPILSTSPFILHKTTFREIYQHHLDSKLKEVDDVLLYNERREITETTIGNVAVFRNGKWITPQLSCGLLLGTMRQHLLELEKVEEGVVSVDELLQTPSPSLIVFNSVREVMKAVLWDALRN